MSTRAIPSDLVAADFVMGLNEGLVERATVLGLTMTDCIDIAEVKQLRKAAQPASMDGPVVIGPFLTSKATTKREAEEENWHADSSTPIKFVLDCQENIPIMAQNRGLIASVCTVEEAQEIRDGARDPNVQVYGPWKISKE